MSPSRLTLLLAIAALPLSLSLWYYRILLPASHPRVYFIYDNALFFLSDAVALVIVALYLISIRSEPNRKFSETPVEPVETSAGSRSKVPLSQTRLQPNRKFSETPVEPVETSAGSRPGASLVALDFILLSLLFLSSASALWSFAPAYTLYTALHGWLMFALYFVLRRIPSAAASLAVGACVVLLGQSFLSIAEFLGQTTAILAPLGMEWPGSLTPDVRGASVVQSPDGVRWLRAYGTLPHPNILGGLLLALLGAPAALFLAGRSPALTDPMWRRARRFIQDSALLGITILGAAALALSFSRAAWLGLAAGGCVLALHLRWLHRRRLAVWALAVAVGLLAALAPNGSLVVSRTGGAPVGTELRSNSDRKVLGLQAWELFRQYPLTGVGAGAYVVAQAELLPGALVNEPVHSVWALAGSELGVGGVIALLLVAGYVLAVAHPAYSQIKGRGLGLKEAGGDSTFLPWPLFLSRKRGSSELYIVSLAALAGLLMVSLFDHYLWTQPPMRTLAWVLLGIWAGSVRSLQLS